MATPATCFSPFDGHRFSGVRTFYREGIMDRIVKWTTPTFIIRFETIDPASLAEAYLSVVFKTAVITKGLDQATVSEHELVWTLTQEETGSLPLGQVVLVYCDWKTPDGTRGRSHRKDLLVAETGIDEVM